MIKLLPEKYKRELLKIMTYCYEKGEIMEDWKENITIFIDKGTKRRLDQSQ